MAAPDSTITLYGSSISYFTGKMENYFRVKGLPYRREPLTARGVAPQAFQQLGTAQHPAVRLADGRWLTDSTVMIQWFEQEYGGPPILPTDPVQRFICLLLEDYADEWLWRPAMHYRWHYEEGARWAGDHLARELAADLPAPHWLKRRRITARQRNGYTVGDGITADQVAGIEAIYSRTLATLEAIFRERPFLLGSRPSLADIGFSGPFFRHFGLDPVPAEMLRQQAPNVLAWIGRLWTTGAGEGQWVDGVPEDLKPLLREIGDAYLPYLNANARAVAQGTPRFDCTVGGVTYRGARWSRYRVWCLARLREAFAAIPAAAVAEVRGLMESEGCWAPLWEIDSLPLTPGLCSKLPFRADAKMIDVYR